MVVASLLDGRVRLRDEGLKKEPLVSQVREALLATPGVRAVEANTRVGSVLILYSAALTAVDKILKTVAHLLGADEEVRVGAEPTRTSEKTPLLKRIKDAVFPKVKKTLSGISMPAGVKQKLVNFRAGSVIKRRIVGNIGMLASLVLSMGAALFGLKKLHILAGIVFLFAFGDHFYQRRARVFA
jgi:hypothetical protein